MRKTNSVKLILTFVALLFRSTPDLRLAVRRLLAAPGFTVAAVLTLALGAGANTLTFSAIRGLLIRPLPFAHGDRLVWVQGRNATVNLGDHVVGGDEVQALAQRMTGIDGIAVIGSSGLIHADGQHRSEWKGLWVSANLAAVLEVQPAIGRTFAAADMHTSAARPALIAYERWQRDLGGDPNVIGRVLSFADNKRITVIGVLPRGLEFPFGRTPGAGSGSEFRAGVQDFWVLGQEKPEEYPGGMAVARLRDGVTTTSAQAEADAIVAKPDRSLQLVTFRDYALGTMRPALPLLEAFAALVLLIACANLASLVLARATKTRGEFAVRAALGAGQSDLFRILIAESLVICAAGTLAGLALAWGGQTVLRTFAQEHLTIVARLEMDAGVLLFSTLLAAITSLAFGLIPMRVLRDAPAVSLLDRNARGQTFGPGQRRTFGALVVAQVAITLVLLNAAALVLQSLNKLMTVDTGYDRSSVVAADIMLFEPGKEVVAYFQRLHERLRALPGVEAVGLVQSTPLTGKWTFTERLVVNGHPPDARSELDIPGTFVAYDYFRAMGIPVIAGRDFTEADLLVSPRRAMIINDVAAALFFPGESAVGREFVLFGRPREIVGVVKGTRDVRLDTPATPQFYQPTFTGSSQVIVRTSEDPAVFAGTLRRELIASDPRLIVKNVKPLGDIVSASVFERSLATRLLSVLALLALTLALVGLYGVLTFTTVQRRREMGIRIALGARRADILRLVIGQGLGLTAAGIAVGLFGCFVVSTSLRSLLFGVHPRDGMTLAMATVALVTAGAMACFKPAWRAAAVDPADTLRVE
jgi:predicted permease